MGTLTHLPGALLPLPRGQMRNEWFPRGIADYVLPPEVKKLRLSNVPIQRDHFFARKEKVIKVPSTGNAEGEMSKDQITSASKFAKKVDVGRLPPHRMVALLEAFIGPRLDFYRQPIAEEKVEEVAEEKAPEPPKKREHFGSGAGADLLAARMEKPTSPKKEDSKAQAIYGSVSPLDVVQALRAALAFDDDAKRVVLSEQDVQFVDLPEMEGEAAKVVKHVGDFEVEITIRGSDTPVRRTVRVIPQEP